MQTNVHTWGAHQNKIILAAMLLVAVEHIMSQILVLEITAKGSCNS